MPTDGRGNPPSPLTPLPHAGEGMPSPLAPLPHAGEGNQAPFSPQWEKILCLMSMVQVTHARFIATPGFASYAWTCFLAGHLPPASNLLLALRRWLSPSSSHRAQTPSRMPAPASFTQVLAPVCSPLTTTCSNPFRVVYPSVPVQCPAYFRYLSCHCTPCSCLA